jgi:hypothetical protein
MMKSVWLSGRKSSCDCVPCVQPLPDQPPEPIAVLDWMMFQPAPSRSLSGIQQRQDTLLLVILEQKQPGRPGGQERGQRGADDESASRCRP